jgi:hypothetical protein
MRFLKQFLSTFLTLLLNLPVIAFFFVLALDNVEIDHLASKASVSEDEAKTEIIGSGHPDDPCTVEIESSAVADLKKMGVENWVDACVEATHAENPDQKE